MGRAEAAEEELRNISKRHELELEETQHRLLLAEESLQSLQLERKELHLSQQELEVQLAESQERNQAFESGLLTSMPGSPGSCMMSPFWPAATDLKESPNLAEDLATGRYSLRDSPDSFAAPSFGTDGLVRSSRLSWCPADVTKALHSSRRGFHSILRTLTEASSLAALASPLHAWHFLVVQGRPAIERRRDEEETPRSLQPTPKQGKGEDVLSAAKDLAGLMQQAAGLHAGVMKMVSARRAQREAQHAAARAMCSLGAISEGQEPAPANADCGGARNA